MSQQPRVCLGLPVYNGERFLEEALQCALAQTLDDFELIVSDNASTDRSAEIVRDYASRDPRIQVHCAPENRGAAWNFNRAFALSRAAYFKWMAHDDRFAPTFLERCVEVLDSDPSVVLAYPSACQIDENGARLGPVRFELHGESDAPHHRFRYQICIDHWCFHVFGVIRADALRRTRLIDRYVASDRVLLSHLALMGRIHEVPEELFFQRQHDSRSTAAHPSLDGRSAWFDPSRHDSLVFPSWRLGSEYFLSVLRSPLSLRERALCHLQLVRWLKYYWRDLGEDLAIAFEHLFRRQSA